MILAIAAIGATGIVLFLSGLPLGRKPSLMRRIEPYLSGLHGSPSRLLARPASRHERLMSLAPARLIRRVPTDLAERLEAAGEDRHLTRFGWSK